MTHDASYPRFLRQPRYWRELQRTHLLAERQSRCWRCKGTGEIATVGDYGEYEQPEPCPRCCRATPRPTDTDSKPF